MIDAMDSSRDKRSGAGAGFQSTHWSLVLRAGREATHPATFSIPQELLVDGRQVQIEIAEAKPLTGNRGTLQSDETALGDLGVRQHSFLLAVEVNLKLLAGKVDFEVVPNIGPNRAGGRRPSPAAAVCQFDPAIRGEGDAQGRRSQVGLAVEQRARRRRGSGMTVR